MMMDLVPTNTRSFGFPLVASFNALAPMLGYVFGFFLLSADIADYRLYCAGPPRAFTRP
jgi:hypothetical protein